jgi:eukaryotic-like serine/threonine-protein kinase
MALQERGAGRPVESPEGGISQPAVRAQLERILADPLFLRSNRLSRFLSFVVDETLRGEQNSLKEYQLGVEVCDRGKSYDPRTDPVVRVEARRLRSALESYYANGGRDDSVIISLPKGGYVPCFTQREAIRVEQKPSSVRRKWTLAALTLALAFALVAVVAYWHFRPSPGLTEKDTVVVADFANKTGDPVFDETLRHGLTAQLEQSPFLNLLSDARAAQTIALMAQSKEARLTADIARQICERTGSTASIEGSISMLGGQYVLSLEAVNCHSGDVLAQEQVTADSKERVLPALATAATQLRRKLGESLASVQKFDAPPENVTTPSLEALQAYSLGFNVHVVDLDEARAAQLFQRAVRLDPDFAMAYARLATCYLNLGEPSLAAESMRKAYALRERVSDHERLFIVSQYQRYVAGDLESAEKTYQLRAELYPHDDIPVGNVGNDYFSLGEYAKAVAATEEAIRRNPGSRIWHGNMVGDYVAANQLQKAKAVAVDAANDQLDSTWLHLWLYQIDFLEQNDQAMQRDTALIKRSPGFEDALLYYQSQAAIYAGRLGESRDLSRRAVQSAQRSGQSESGAIYAAEEGLREALVGNPGLATQQARTAMSISDNRFTEAIAAITFGVAGDSREAKRLGDDLLKRYPEDTLVKGIYSPMIRAVAALYGAQKDPGKAIEALAASAPYELGSQAMTRVAFLTCYPIYFRGKAYLASGQGQSAASEFQKIIDNPQVTMTDPIRAFAFLGLARAYESSGDKIRSREAYDKFRALWKNPDRDIPLLKEATRQFGD